ncbi:hypothetical protein HELRODRAFT_183721 [Helobdella robusta]|uniref:Saposin B-type domain-containing protein n=1 Tax=Helobdella robusta TaxID=6412 RepID=T1FK39_HELRO|nr:hypothetical protein HELRODRAFT_183721 [Helobdella robusta]ESO10349.1 hypothetical protein HELRODRAFT_183721 [Helobdella robusta]
MNLIALITLAALQCASVQPIICSMCSAQLKLLDELEDFNDPCFVRPPAQECDHMYKACYVYLLVNMTKPYTAFDNGKLTLETSFVGDKSNCGKPDELFTIGEHVTTKNKKFYKENIVNKWKSSRCVDKSETEEHYFSDYNDQSNTNHLEPDNDSRDEGYQNEDGHEIYHESDDKNKDDREDGREDDGEEIHPDGHSRSEQKGGSQDVNENYSNKDTKDSRDHDSRVNSEDGEEY